MQGRTQGEGPGGSRALSLGPKKHYNFSVSSVKLRAFRLCNTCSKAFCYVREEACNMVMSLRKVYFRTLLATIYENFCSGPPLEKILGAPLDTCFLRIALQKASGPPQNTSVLAHRELDQTSRCELMKI